MIIVQTVDSPNHKILKSTGLVLATVLLVGGCSATPSLPVLTDAPPKAVDSVQTMYQVGSNRFDGFWDIHASGDEDEVVNEDEVFVCPAFSQTYRVIVSNGEIQNALSDGFHDVPVSQSGEFAFTSETLKTINSFMKYQLSGVFPDTSTDYYSTGSGTILWRDSIYGTKGANCKAEIKIRRSTVLTYSVTEDALLFDMSTWRTENRHHDKRLPGYLVIQQPLHGQLSKRGLKRGKLVYLPDNDFSGEDFLAIRLLQSSEPFTMYRYFNLLVN